MPIIGALAAGAALGLLAASLRIPGGLILGSMIGAAAYSLFRDLEVAMPPIIESSALIVVGSSIGLVVTRAFIQRLSAIAIGAFLAAFLIILAGVGIALLLRWLGIAPPGDSLATSPGALSVMAAAALQEGHGAAEVATFHTVRVILVILSLPLLKLILTEGS